MVTRKTVLDDSLAIRQWGLSQTVRHDPRPGHWSGSHLTGLGWVPLQHLHGAGPGPDQAGEKVGAGNDMRSDFPYSSLQ